MKRKRKLKIISVTTFALEVILLWIIGFIFGYTWLYGFDKISKILGIGIIIGIIIVIISAFLNIIKIKHDFLSYSPKPMFKKTGTVIVFIVFIAIHSIMYYSFFNMGYTVCGTFNIASKQTANSKYYFYVKSTADNHLVELECTKDIYENLIVNRDVLYSFSYRYLTYNSYKGVLEGSIDTTDMIDNRR